MTQHAVTLSSMVHGAVKDVKIGSTDADVVDCDLHFVRLGGRRLDFRDDWVFLTPVSDGRTLH
jgi:hypothetical protein